MRTLASSIFAAVYAMVSLPATAAMVVPDQGEVRISTDQGFRKIETASEVVVATSVLVAPGGRAIISYSESCKVEVRSFATVQREAPCGGYGRPAHFGYEQSASKSPSDMDYDFTPKVGGRGSPAPKVGGGGLFDHHTLLILGGAAVTAGLAALLLSGGGDDEPASP